MLILGQSSSKGILVLQIHLLYQNIASVSAAYLLQNTFLLLQKLKPLKFPTHFVNIFSFLLLIYILM